MAFKAIKSLGKKVIGKLGEGFDKIDDTFKTIKDDGIKTYSKKKANSAKVSATNLKINAKNAKDGFVDNVLLSGDQIKIGPLNISTRGGVANEIAFHSRAIQDTAIGAWDIASNGIGSRRFGQLVERTDDSLLGYKTTKLGTGVAFAGAVAMGMPSAVEEYNTTRQGQFAGVYQMGAIPGLVPQGHAYANNAGATGDLVLALNNNR